MAYTIYEYDTVNGDGEPVEPPSARTVSQALGVASAAMASTTVYVVVVPDANQHLRISDAGTAATTADLRLAAGKRYGFPIPVYSRPKLYGLAAAVSAVDVLPPFSRSDFATANFTPASSYAASTALGGLITVATGRPSTQLRLTNIGLVVPMATNTTPGSGAVIIVFGSAPTGSYSDAAAPTWTATDTNRIRRAPTLGFVWGSSTSSLATYASQSTAWPIDVTTDASGNIYFMILAASAIAWATPGSARFTADYLY